MPNSLEKIQQLAQEYSGTPPEDSGALDLAFRSAVVTLGPMFLSQLPDDPAVLDEGLEEMAGRLLELRSDGAPSRILVGPTPAQLPAGDE